MAARSPWKANEPSRVSRSRATPARTPAARQTCREPWARARQPMPMFAARQQKQRRAGDRQDRGIFREQCEAGAQAGGAATTPTCHAVASARTRQSAAPSRRTIERSVRQHPGAGGDAEHRRKVQQHRGPQPGASIGDRRPEAEHQPGGQREQRDERQAHDDRRLAAGQMRGTPGKPPAKPADGRNIRGAARDRRRPCSFHPRPARASRRIRPAGRRPNDQQQDRAVDINGRPAGWVDPHGRRRQPKSPSDASFASGRRSTSATAARDRIELQRSPAQFVLSGRRLRLPSAVSSSAPATRATLKALMPTSNAPTSELLQAKPGPANSDWGCLAELLAGG